jgi:hypothetical protein
MSVEAKIDNPTMFHRSKVESPVVMGVRISHPLSILPTNARRDDDPCSQDLILARYNPALRGCLGWQGWFVTAELIAIDIESADY